MSHSHLNKAVKCTSIRYQERERLYVLYSIQRITVSGGEGGDKGWQNMYQSVKNEL